MSKITTAATGQHSNAGFTHSWKWFFFVGMHAQKAGRIMRGSVRFFKEYPCEEYVWSILGGREEDFIVLDVIK